MRTNYILIDYENTQPETVPLVEGVPVKVLVFVGAKQPTLPTKFVTSVHALGSEAEYIQIDGVGKNALDFHIAYFIGKFSQEDPNSYFYIVSKDQGYDSLIKYLNKSRTPTKRIEQLTKISVMFLADQTTVEEKTQRIEDLLGGIRNSLPGKVSTLASFINSRFSKLLGDEEIKKIIELLQSRGTVTVADGVVEYAFPEDESIAQAA